MTSPGRKGRGQATVELAIGLLFFITVLAFGIHIGEMGYLMAKAHEAAAHALWDSTAWQTYQFDPAPWHNSGTIAAPRVSAEATASYADFDGVAGFAGPPKLVFSEGLGLTVNCVQDAAVNYPLTVPLWSPLVQNYYVEPSGISCTATAQAQPFGMPKKFMEVGSGGFFHFANYLGPNISTFCGMGVASSGNCANNKMSILLGDYGLNMGNGGKDAQECYLTTPGGACHAGAGPGPGDNMSFFHLAQGAANGSMPGGTFYTGAPERLCNSGVPDCPSRVTDFYLSFRGSESNFVESPAGNTLSDKSTVWETSPYSASAYPSTAPPDPYKKAYQTAMTCRNSTGGAYPYCFLGRFPCD